ncbi:hypothetical protein C475_16776 [Halosimplex carlsbadense 2-9-1]|uniref:Uncharacterized protein n=2 Tax=Halosimplex carlsbadense TaxID=171164 RepID=M0CHJ9_9EURY|nr:hypothetical protein C475_16776 [Halosimplex carlsbadense 2-9-1]
MILLAGFAMAVTLLVLAVVINSAIATENLGTRSDIGSTSGAVTYQGAVERGALEAFRYANEVNGSDDHDELAANVTTAVEAVSALSARQQVTRGYVPNASVVDTVEGTAIRDDTGEFTGPNDDSNWTVANSVSGVREFSLYVDRWNSTSPHEFRVVASDPSTWYLNVSYDGSEYEVGVTDSGAYQSCYSGPSGNFWVNVSAGTVAGSPCPALDMGSLGSYDLAFENGSAVEEGRYSLVVNRSAASRYDTDPGEPRGETVLYSATVDLRYRGPDLSYRTSLRIAPGESDA